MEAKIVYFEKPGKKNTDQTLALANQRAKELGIKTVVVASTWGDTAVKAVSVFEGLKLVVVTNSYGISAPNTLMFTDENREIVENKGGKILISTEGFGGLVRALRTRSTELHRGDTLPSVPPRGEHTIGDILFCALGIFCRGMAVACMIAGMAADAGLVRTDEDVICIAGTHAGADTAIVLQPANLQTFFELKVKEIICKPRL